MSAVLILGAAACLWDDLKALGHWDGDVMAVNRAGVHYSGQIAHWVTLHPEHLPEWIEARAVAFGPSEFTTWCQREGDDVDNAVTDIGPYGSSGLFAVRIALQRLGYQRVVLAGMPIDDGPHFYDAGGRRSGPTFEWYRPEWIKARHLEIRGRLRSLSGWTREKFGAPDREWMNVGL